MVTLFRYFTLWSARSSKKKKKNQKSLLAFISELTGALRLAGKSNSKLMFVSNSKRWQECCCRQAVPDEIYNLHDHFLDFHEKKGTCCYWPIVTFTEENAIWYYVYTKTAIFFTYFTINCKMYLIIGIVFYVNMCKLKILFCLNPLEKLTI